MPIALQLLILGAVILAAMLAGSAHARRREHPRFVHHSIGYTIVAVLAAATLILFGPR